MSGISVALDTSVAIAVLAGQAGSLLSQSSEEFLLPQWGDQGAKQVLKARLQRVERHVVIIQGSMPLPTYV